MGRNVHAQDREIAQTIIFSLREGYVWANWPEAHVYVRLGPHEVVAPMMQDFLAQDALVARLIRAGKAQPMPNVQALSDAPFSGAPGRAYASLAAKVAAKRQP